MKQNSRSHISDCKTLVACRKKIDFTTSERLCGKKRLCYVGSACNDVNSCWKHTPSLFGSL